MISFVIPAYDSAWNIERLIGSVIAQKDPSDEVVVVDDHSSDDTVMRASRFTGQGVKVVVQEKNKGPAAARNRGAKEAQGEFLFFLDSDTQLERGSVAAFRRMRSEHPEIRCVNGISKSPLDRGLTAQYKALLEYSWVAGAQNLDNRSLCFNSRVGAIERKLFFETAGFNEKYKKAEVEDYEFGHEAVRKAKIYLNKEIRVRHRFGNLKSVTKNYFHRTFLWLGLFFRRKTFDAVGGTSFGSASEYVTGALALGISFFSIFFPTSWLFLCGAWGIFVFCSRRFLFLAVKERGLLMAVLYLFLHLYFSLVIVASAGFSLIYLPLSKRRAEPELELAGIRANEEV